MRQRLSNLLHRWAHLIDPAAQPLCLCRSKAFVELLRMRQHPDWAPKGLARNPDELRALIAASEQEAS